MQFNVKTLPAKPQQIRSQRTVVIGELQSGLNRQPFDHIGRLANELLEGDSSNEFGQLID